MKKQKVGSDNVASPGRIPNNKEDALCFVCFTGGSLICCDVPSCPRVYHASCLRLRRQPSEEVPFICPWHFASVEKKIKIVSKKRRKQKKMYKIRKSHRYY